MRGCMLMCEDIVFLCKAVAANVDMCEYSVVMVREALEACEYMKLDHVSMHGNGWDHRLRKHAEMH